MVVRIFPSTTSIFWGDWLISAVLTGFVVSKMYSNGMLGLAIISFIAPYFLLLFLIIIYGPMGFGFILPSDFMFLAVPFTTMFSAIFSKKEFRSKIGL